MTASRVTLRDVAKAAGVAESTVSRALAGHGQLAAQTRRRIIDAAREVGYDTTSKLALPQAEGRAGVVGVVVAGLQNSFYPFLVDVMHNELDALGYDMVLIIDDLNDERASRKLNALISSLDGIVVTTAAIGSPMVDFLVSRDVPTVLAIRSNMAGNVDVVESDNFNAGAEAITHLLELGHRDIGFVLGPASTSTTHDRLAGARSVLHSHDMALQERWVIYGGYSHGTGYSGMVQLMRQPNPPTAILCANDVIAVGALEAALKMGLSVPDDVSLVGFDDIPMSGWQMISLTTIRQPIEEIGALAAKVLVSRIEGNTAPGAPRERHILPTRIIRRSTTGTPRQTPLSHPSQG